MSEATSYRPIEGFPGYRVGDDGSVWSCRNRGGGLDDVWHVVKGVPGGRGHLRVTLRKGARSHNHSVHRLVLTAFVGPCPEGMQGCHFPDRDPANCRLDNLRWGTSADNTDDSRKHGTMYRGERQHLARLAETEVRAIRARHLAARGRRRKLPNGALAAIAKDFGISLTTAGQIAAGKTWKHVT